MKPNNLNKRWVSRTQPNLHNPTDKKGLLANQGFASYSSVSAVHPLSVSKVYLPANRSLPTVDWLVQAMSTFHPETGTNSLKNTIPASTTVASRDSAYYGCRRRA